MGLGGAEFAHFGKGFGRFGEVAGEEVVDAEFFGGHADGFFYEVVFVAFKFLLEADGFGLREGLGLGYVG